MNKDNEKKEEISHEALLAVLGPSLRDEVIHIKIKQNV